MTNDEKNFDEWWTKNLMVLERVNYARGRQIWLAALASRPTPLEIETAFAEKAHKEGDQ